MGLGLPAWSVGQPIAVLVTLVDLFVLAAVDLTQLKFEMWTVVEVTSRQIGTLAQFGGQERSDAYNADLAPTDCNCRRRAHTGSTPAAWKMRTSSCWLG